MNRAPIIILTKDNPEYLYVTLRSLKATETFESPVIIVDDSSETPNGKDFLYKNDVMNVSFDDWTFREDDIYSTQMMADKVAGASYLKIPKIDKICGINGKYTIVRTPSHLGKLHRILFGMKVAFSSYPADTMCALVDDDVMFNKDWLKESYKLYEYEHFKKKVGLICPFAEKRTDEESVEYYMNGIVRGKAVLATKSLYDAFNKMGFYRGIEVPGEGPAWFKLQKCAERLNFTCYSTRESYIQNLEKRNLVNREKVLQYDLNFKMPAAWSDEEA